MTLCSPGLAFRQALSKENPCKSPARSTPTMRCWPSGPDSVPSTFRRRRGGRFAGAAGSGHFDPDDVLTDIRRITDVCPLPLLVDVDSGFGASAFNVARTVRSVSKAGAAALHIEDQVGAKRCGHRPNKAIVSTEEMVDRIKAAVDARSDPDFVIMARTDALAVEGLEAAIERAQAYVAAGADMLFPEAITELGMYRRFAEATQVPILANITEFGATPLFTTDELRSARGYGAVSAVGLPGDEPRGGAGIPCPARRGHAEKRHRHHADPQRAVRKHQLLFVRRETRRSVRSPARRISAIHAEAK